MNLSKIVYVSINKCIYAPKIKLIAVQQSSRSKKGKKRNKNGQGTSSVEVPTQSNITPNPTSAHQQPALHLKQYMKDAATIRDDVSTRIIQEQSNKENPTQTTDTSTSHLTWYTYLVYLVD